MVQIMDKIPEKKAKMIRVPGEKPEIDGMPGYETIGYENFNVPNSLNRKLFNRCGVDVKREREGITKQNVENRMQETANEKNLYMRFAGDKPLSVVTDEFQPVSPRRLYREAVNIIGEEPTVRYFANTESLQFNFPVDGRFKGMNLVINTGEYGVYAGSGKNAISYGIAWFNETCSNWTIFLDKTLQKSMGKFEHRKSNELEGKLQEAREVVYDLNGKIEESRDVIFDQTTLNEYFNMYESKGIPKKITKQIREENPNGMNVYDLSYRLTELIQDDKISDRTRAKVEYLAGEVILCHEDILARARPELNLGGYRRQGGRVLLPNNYVRLN